MYTHFLFHINGSLFSCQVLGEMIHITTEYLTNEERVIMANSKVEALEVESSKLRKDHITAMDGWNNVKKQLKALTGKLQVVKLLTV